ncbi:MAG: tryptophan-rich sensory protein [Alphaproteobacteria bacterium]|nr:tryptophan-rich sensory protein [Alphaproteobacteria bacterium]
MKINYQKLIYCFVMTFAAMAIGAYYNDFGMEKWYHNISQPAATPPDMVFPIVWGILYALMATSFYLTFVTEDKKAQNQKINSLFIGLLFLHIVWTYCFFYMGYIALAFGVLLFIDFLSYYILMMFWGIHKTAAWLFMPYFLWILFATYLNAAFINLNSYIIVVE